MWLSPKHLLIGAALLVGVALTAVLVAFTAVTQRSLEDEAILQQGLHSETLAAELEAHLAVSRQIARSVSSVVAPMRDLPAIEELLRRLLASTTPDYVYGIGVWFEPYALDPQRRYVGPYVHRGLENLEEIVLTYEWSTPSYDYLGRPWYLQGLAAGGAPYLTEPYFDMDFVYRSICQAFYAPDGTLLGVVSVDTILPQLRKLVLRANASPHETLYIVTREGRLFAHPDEQQLLEWARARGRAGPAEHLSDLTLSDLRAYEHEKGLDVTRYTGTSRLGSSGWAVYASTDKEVLFANVRRFRATAWLSGGALWAALLAGGVAGGRTLRVQALTRELVAQRSAQEALECNEQRLREVLETSMDAVISVDRAGRISGWNASAEQMFGWQRQDTLGRPAVETLIPPSERIQREEQFLRAVSSGRVTQACQRVEAMALRRNGELFPVEVSLSVVRSCGPREIYAFVSDISQRRRMEEERQRMWLQQRELLAQLRVRSAELQAIIDNMVEGVFVAHADGRFALINQSGRQLVGASSLEKYRLKVEVLRAFSIRARDGKPLQLEELPLLRALRGEEVVGEDVLMPDLKDGGGDLVVRCNAAPIRDEAGKVVAAVVVTHDITEAMRLEQIKDEFIQAAAHELKTPVTVIKSFAQLALRTELGRTTSLRRMLEGINRGASRIDHMVGTLLDVSQMHLGRMKWAQEELELWEVLEGTVQRVAEEHPERAVSLSARGKAPVRGDRARLEQMLAALLDNALRYSPPGTPVEVALGVSGGEAEVSVRDHGIGIPAEKQQRLFERFYRPHSSTPHDRGGLGMGLYIARAIVQQHQGRILLESREGEGTTVRIRLPLREVRPSPGSSSWEVSLRTH
jgi:PAS domain S-box-containing protein